MLELCRLRGIKVLSTIIATGIKNKTIIVEDGATYDLDSNIRLEKSVEGEKSNIENKE